MNSTVINHDLKRVSDGIGKVIIDFAKIHRTFHMDALRQYVEANVGKIAPGSPDRILRDLRKRGHIQYVCLSRPASLYQITGVRN